jgi:undecaprenyl-phosphate galactose phosphotransferase/putative colanic acid biosynthesis UDP-glucose lipid carrier transferase
VLINSGVREKEGELGSISSVSLSFSGKTIPYVLCTVDTFIILLAGLAGGIGYQSFVGNPPDPTSQIAIGLLASFFYTLQVSRSGFYDFPWSGAPKVETREILIFWTKTVLLLALMAFLFKVGGQYSRGSLIIFYFVAPIGLLSARKLTKIAFAEALSRGVIGRRDAVLIGEPDEMAALRPEDLLAMSGAIDVKRFLLSREDDCAARSSVDDRVINAVADFVRQHDCREILLALPWRDTDRIEFVRDRIKVLPAAARLLPDSHARSLMKSTPLAQKRSFTIEIQRPPLSGAQRLIKRMIDIVVSALALVFFLPIMALTAIAIKLDSPGPVIFRQNRKGFNGKQFIIFKFRTMTVQEDGLTIVQASRDDSRVTTIGRLLRSSSIDELPQLFNVLRGDMSLIGPRPHALAHDHYFESVLSDYAFRHHVKPGITGWAQCNGARGSTPSIEHISERVKLDLWYINNWSLWLDIQILTKTFFEVLRKHNAY